jgi:ectoine hydroxylase
MKLTPEQHAEFDREGYLFFPGLFTPDETKNLVDANLGVAVCLTAFTA